MKFSQKLPPNLFYSMVQNVKNDQKLKSRGLKDLMDCYGLTQLCTEPTHLNHEGKAQQSSGSDFH